MEKVRVDLGAMAISARNSPFTVLLVHFGPLPASWTVESCTNLFRDKTFTRYPIDLKMSSKAEGEAWSQFCRAVKAVCVSHTNCALQCGCYHPIILLHHQSQLHSPSHCFLNQMQLPGFFPRRLEQPLLRYDAKRLWHITGSLPQSKTACYVSRLSSSHKSAQALTAIALLHPWYDDPYIQFAFGSDQAAALRVGSQCGSLVAQHDSTGYTPPPVART